MGFLIFLGVQRYSDVWRPMSGDVIHLTAMHMHIVVLNKMKDVIALFEKRSAIYSDRVAIPACKMMYEDFDFAYKECASHSLFFRLGAEHLTPLLSYGDEWRQHRRLYQETFSKSVMPSYAQVQTEKVHILLELLLRSPTKFAEHCKW